LNTAQPCKELEVCDKFITLCINENWHKELKAGFKARSRIRESIINARRLNA